MTNVLVITPPVWMFHWIHRNTSDFGPRISFDTVFVKGTTGFQHGFVWTSTTRGNTDAGTAQVGQRFFAAGWHAHGDCFFYSVVRNDSDVFARSFGHFTSIPSFGFDVEHDGTFGYFGQRQNVPNFQRRFFTTVQVLSSVSTLRCNEQCLCCKRRSTPVSLFCSFDHVHQRRHQTYQI